MIRGGGSKKGREGRDTYQVVSYRSGYSFTKQHSHLLSHTESLQKGHMETWHPLGGVRESFICWFCPVSYLSLDFFQWGVKTTLHFQVVLSSSSRPPLGKPIQCCGLLLPWHHDTRQKAAKASAWASGHSWALDLLWLPPWQTLQRPCQRPVLTQGAWDRWQR